MKNPAIISGSSSSILITHRCNFTILVKQTFKQPHYSPLVTTISCLSKPYPQWTSSTSATSDTTSKSKPSFLLTSIYPSGKDSKGSLSSYADIASRLVLDGRFADFVLILESILTSGAVDPSEFGKLLNLKLISAGIVRCLNEGRVQSVVELLGSIAKLGVDVVGLFEGSAMGLLKKKLVGIAIDGNVEEAVTLLEIFAGFQFSIRHLIKQDDLIRACVDQRNPHMAVRYACLHPQRPVLLCSIIKEFGKRGDFASALVVFESSKKLDGQNMFVYRSIIDVCGLCGDCFTARSIFEDLFNQKITPNIYVFNSLINVNAHDLTYTMDMYKKMEDLGVSADMATYNILLKACCLAGRVELAQKLYEEVKTLELTGALKLDVFTYSTIVKAFTDAKMWQMALQIKEDMISAGVNPNTVTWSSLISACANAGLVDQAVQLFEEMLWAGCEPNTRCFNILLHACVEACQYDRAFRLFQAWKGGKSPKITDNSEDLTRCSADHAIVLDYLLFVKSVPFRPTTATFNTLMKACGSDFYRAKALMDEMKRMGLTPNQISWSTLINICGNSGNMAGAVQMLNSMSETGIKPDVVAYTAAIKACVECKNLNTAYSLFEEMKRYRVQPNLVTYNTLLRARTRYRNVKEVQQCLSIYQDMRKSGYRPNDNYLKQLLEEWCEGVAQGDDKKCELVDSSESGGQESLFLEKVALHLQRTTTESFAVDIQGLSKVEARIVVLAVLRMIKENYTSGHSIEDDLIIVLGVRKFDSESTIKDAICHLLRDELGLEVIPVKPSASSHVVSDSVSKYVRGTNELPVELETNARRPAILQRLQVSKRSLYQWLQKRGTVVDQ